MNYKEDIEWTNSWCVECNDTNKKRILLVGDSICNGYYEDVQREMGDEFIVNKLATSRSIASDFFMTQLKMHLDDFHYDYVSFNNGLHDFRIDDDEYRKAYEKALDLIGDKVFIVTSTPITVKGKDDILADENKITISRNKIVNEIASKRGIEVCDLYSVAVGKSEIRIGDGYHYNADGYKLLGKNLADFLKTNM